MEAKHFGRLGGKGVRICNGRRNFGRFKKEFGEEDNKMMKVAELKKVEQGNKTMEEFIQEFRRTARESKYEERPLMEKFKREINEVIKRKLIEAKRPPRNIEQWYERVKSLDRH